MSPQTVASHEGARRRRVVVDASVVLAFYLPAEPFKAQALMLAKAAAGGQITLCAPTLLRYEILNVLALALRGVKKVQRISLEDAIQILGALGALELEEHAVSGLESRVLAISKDHQCSAYDASYLAVAEHLNADLLTGDSAFHRTLKEHFPRIKFVGQVGSTG